MAHRHWLDPLARRLLLAAGLIPKPPATQPLASPTPAPLPSANGFIPNLSGDNRPGASQVNENDRDESIETDLLALKLEHNPALRLGSAAEVRRAASLGWRLDVNRATAADWLRLPGISADQVDRLLRLQRAGVQLSGAEDLQHSLELSPAQLAAWLPLLDFRWYAGPPAAMATPPRLDLNKATASALSQLGLSAERCQRLLRERARGPFQDLADLQQRLQFPADLVEGWIGKVRFSQGQAGPALPQPGTPGPGTSKPAAKGPLR